MSPNGIEEADINLAVTLRTDAVLGLIGERTLLTRSGEEDLSSEEAVTISQKKVSDIRRRVEIVNTHAGAILVSIHQNTYSDPACRGCQVFYGSEEGSRELANIIRENVHQTLDQGSYRVSKPIRPDVYLMNHITVPGVLVECGFLTNPEDEANLQNGAYQNRLAVVLAGSVANYQPEPESGV